MITTLSTQQVIQALFDEDDNWTYEEAKALAEYYEELEDDIGEPIELDIVAIRCEWNALSLEEVREAYNVDGYVTALDYLQRNTQVIQMDDDQVLFIEF
jgi:hypothetical protein